jgi:hypothetical protein
MGAKGMKRDVPCFFFVVARTLLVFPRGRTKEPNKDMRLINRRHLISQTTITHLVAPSMNGWKRRHENIADDAGEGNDH